MNPEPPKVERERFETKTILVKREPKTISILIRPKQFKRKGQFYEQPRP